MVNYTNKHNFVILVTFVNYVINVIIYQNRHLYVGDALCSLVAKRE
jgi:hypothetical protein